MFAVRRARIEGRSLGAYLVGLLTYIARRAHARARRASEHRPRTTAPARVLLTAAPGQGLGVTAARSSAPVAAPPLGAVSAQRGLPTRRRVVRGVPASSAAALLRQHPPAKRERRFHRGQLQGTRR
jgi:hypothetical protein